MTPEEKARYVELLKRKKALLESQQPKPDSSSLADDLMYPVRAAGYGLDAVQNASNEALDYYLSGQNPSPLAYPGARLFQAVNPTLWGDVGEKTFEKHPEAVRSNEDAIHAARGTVLQSQFGPAAPLVDKMLPSDDSLQAMQTFGAQQLPQAPLMAEGLLKAGAAEAAQYGGPVVNTLVKFAKGAGIGSLFGAGGGFLGAEPGQRIEGAVKGGTDLGNILLGAVPEAGAQAMHEYAGMKVAQQEAALRSQQEAVTAVGNPALNLQRDPLLPPEPVTGKYTGYDKTNPGSRTPTQVVRSPRADPLLPPEPSTTPYLRSGGISEDVLRSMTDAERAAYVTETADQMSREIQSAQQEAPTQTSDIAAVMRRRSLEEAGKTQTYERDEMGTNPGRPSALNKVPRGDSGAPYPMKPEGTARPFGPGAKVRDATQAGYVYVREPGMPSIMSEKVPANGAPLPFELVPAEGVKTGDEVYVQDGTKIRKTTFTGYTAEGKPTVDASRGKMRITEEVSPEQLKIVKRDPVEQLPSFTSMDIGEGPTRIAARPGREKWATGKHDVAAHQDTVVRAEQPTELALIADLFPPKGQIGLGDTGARITLAHADELNWARGLLDDQPDMKGVLSPGEMAGVETGPFSREPVTQRMDNGDVAKMGIGPGGSAFEGDLKARMDERRKALRSGNDEKTFVQGAPSAIVKRGEVRGTMPEREMGPYGKFSDELGKAIAGTPEPTTQVGKRKVGNQVVPELSPEPRTVFASKDQLATAEAQAILAKQQTKKDARTMQQPNKVPFVPLPETVQPNASMERDARWVQKRLGQSDSFVDKMAKFASLPEQRAVPQAASAIRGWESAKRMQDVMMAKIFPQLRKALKGMGPAQAKLVERFIAQNVSPERVLQEGHTMLTADVLPPEFHSLYEEGMKQNRRYRDDLIAAGLFSKEQVAKMEQMDAMGLNWLHRDFKRYMDSAFIPRQDKLARAIDWVAEHGKVTPDEAAAHVVELLGTYGEGNPQQRWATSRLNKEILQGREQIPSILRDLMGEIHNPAFVTAASMSEIERMWRQYKVSQTYTAPEYKGIVWDDRPSPGMYETAIPPDKRMYGEFAGKYVTPELFEAIKMAPAPKMQNALARTFGFVSRMFKTSKVALSPITYVINGLSNITNMAAAGLPIWHPNSYARTYQALKAYSEFGDTFLSDRSTALPAEKTDGKWMQWMLEDGAHRPGLGAESAGSEAKALAKRYLREKRGDYLDFLSDVGSRMNNGLAKLGGIYDMMDAVPRLATYIEQVTQAVNKGMDVRTARARAARIINENFVSSGNVGHGVRDVSKYTGMVNPFMTWHADNIRVHTNWMRNAFIDLKKGVTGKPTGIGEGLRSGSGAAQALNVGLHYAILGGALAFARWLNGVTDPELATAESMVKEGYRKNNPLAAYFGMRDERGRPVVVNLTPIIPSSVFIRGGKSNPDPGDLMSRVMLNAGSGFFQSSVMQTPFDNIMAAYGLGEQDLNPDPILPGQEGWKGLQLTYDLLKPGIVQNAEDLARRTQIHQMLASSPLAPIIPDRAMVPGRYEEPWTIGQAAWNTFPLTGSVKVQPVGNTSAEGERMRKVAQEAQLRRNVGTTKKLPVTPAERERLRGTTRGSVGQVRSGG